MTAQYIQRIVLLNVNQIRQKVKASKHHVDIDGCNYQSIESNQVQAHRCYSPYQKHQVDNGPESLYVYTIEINIVSL